MTARAAFVLGFFVVLAALANGGIYSAGHDFVVNRFTGRYEFVPAEEELEEEMPIASRTLTAQGPEARLDRLVRRGAGRAIRYGR